MIVIRRISYSSYSLTVLSNKDSTEVNKQYVLITSFSAVWVVWDEAG